MLKKIKLENIFFLPIVVFIRLISPLIYIRITPLKVARIGHLIGEVEIYLCNKKKDKKSFFTIDLFYIRKNEKICNIFLFNIIKKKIIIIPALIGKKIYQINLKLNRILNSKKSYFYELNFNSSPEYLKINNQQIKMSDNDIEIGRKMAEKINLFSHDKFVCVVCRDSSYLKKNSNGKDFDYLSFRNADIDTFIPASNYITDKGYKVVRIGNVVEKKFEFGNPMVIDYSNTQHVNDLLDIYLISKCEFLITTALGLDMVAKVCRKPIVTVNLCPFGILEYWANKHFMIFKKYFCNNKNKYLTISEIFDNKSAFFSETSHFKKNNIKLVDNTPEEILDVTKECIDYLLNNKIKENNLYQNKFWNIYLSKRKLIAPRFYNKDLNCIINEKFLIKNKNLIQ